MRPCDVRKNGLVCGRGGRGSLECKNKERGNPTNTINIYGAFLCKEFNKEMNVRLSSSVYLVVQF